MFTVCLPGSILVEVVPDTGLQEVRVEHRLWHGHTHLQNHTHKTTSCLHHTIWYIVEEHTKKHTPRIVLNLAITNGGRIAMGIVRSTSCRGYMNFDLTKRKYYKGFVSAGGQTLETCYVINRGGIGHTVFPWVLPTGTIHFTPSNSPKMLTKQLTNHSLCFSWRDIEQFVGED